MRQAQDSALPHVLSKSWERKFADDLATEFETYTCEKRSTIEEMRRFMAVKAYRELLLRMQAARQGKESQEALRSVAYAMRLYARERPALFAATFRTPTTDTPEWRGAVEDLREFMVSILAECGLRGNAADQALRMLRCIVRGFVLHEVTDSVCDPTSYEDSYESAICVFIAGLSGLVDP